MGDVRGVSKGVIVGTIGRVTKGAVGGVTGTACGAVGGVTKGAIGGAAGGITGATGSSWRCGYHVSLPRIDIQSSYSKLLLG